MSPINNSWPRLSFRVLVFTNKIAFQSKADCHTETLFCSCDLDLDPTTLIFELQGPRYSEDVHAYQNEQSIKHR